jgi:mgtE-like transporter
LFIAYTLSVLASVVSNLMGLRGISIQDFLFITMVAGFIEGVTLALLTPAITILGFKKGWDPDNFSIPSITAIGDLIGIIVLFLTAYSLLALKHFDTNLADSIVNLLFIVMSGALIIALYYSRKFEVSRTIMYQMATILVVGLVIQFFSGIFLETRVETFASQAALLIMIPPLIANGGNLGGIFSARLSTAVYLGEVDKAGGLSSRAKRELLTITILAFMTFPVVGLATHVLAILSDKSSPGLLVLIGLSLFVGIMILPVVGIAAYILMKISFRTGLDPDNVVIPILTSVIDLVGIVLLIIGIVIVHSFFPV